VGARGSEAMSLLTDTSPTRTERGWSFELPRSWDFLLPSGGVLQTASLRAAAAELGDDGLRLVSASTVFCTPIQPGRLDAEVTVLRRGGAAAQVRVGLRGAGAPDPGLETIATFAREREGPDVLGIAFPDVPMPDDCPSVLDDTPANSHGRVPFFKNFDCRLALGPRFWQPGWAAGPARYARWYRYLDAPRDAAGRLDRAAHPPIVDTMPPALAHALGPSSYRFFAPSLDLTVHVLDDTERDWLLVQAQVRRARAGHATAEVSVWDDQRRFLASGTQTMFIRTVAGTPPGGIIAPP
jgi:acyl-CoA thioesterase